MIAFFHFTIFNFLLFNAITFFFVFMINLATRFRQQQLKKLNLENQHITRVHTLQKYVN